MEEMWPKPSTSESGWRVSSDRLPILAAVFCGAALIVCLIFAFIIYRCCIMPKKEKHYCARKSEPFTQQPQISTEPKTIPTYPNQSVVYAEPKGYDWGYTNKIVTSQWYPGQQSSYQCTQYPGVCPVPKSRSVPDGYGNTANCKKQRPISQPIGIIISNGGAVTTQQVPMAQISEFSPAHTVQYASSSILDEVGAKDDNSPNTTLKTRSLPAWVRNKPRPLSTEDDLNDLYAKVNFSKKRKNRMRNDEAAIIALSKSRSQFLHKDTDSLVDNEAVIVYDERTAL